MSFMEEYNTAAIVFSILGLAIAIIPARYILKMDRHVGYMIYSFTLKSTNDEKRAISNAGMFYKIFGIVFIIIGVGIGVDI